MKTIIALAALLAIAYGTPIEIDTGPTMTPYPPLPDSDCPDSLCKNADGSNRADGNYAHAANLKYYVACSNGKAKCPVCDSKGALHFSEKCNECLRPADAAADNCQVYTGPTKKPVNVCTKQDQEDAVTFCQNLKNYPDGLAAFDGKSGDFTFQTYSMNAAGQYVANAAKPSHFISCVYGMYGWCKTCPDGLVWHRLLDNQNNEKLDCGICDWAPTTAP